jgi:hypothetical protein
LAFASIAASSAASSLVGGCACALPQKASELTIAGITSHRDFIFGLLSNI